MLNLPKINDKKPNNINWDQSCDFIVNLEHIQQINLIFSILITNLFRMVVLTISTPVMLQWTK